MLAGRLGWRRRGEGEGAGRGVFLLMWFGGEDSQRVASTLCFRMSSKHSWARGGWRGVGVGLGSCP